MERTTSEATIGSKVLTIPAGEIRALAAMKFESKPGGDSAFGATNTVAPLPGTCLFFASGLLGLIAVRRRKGWRIQALILNIRGKTDQEGDASQPLLSGLARVS